ncbi:hypothetical protein [uncultured Xanthomonas sp.]|nr:hypothetical protein [uncultured Xanthomonas sp.]
MAGDPSMPVDIARVCVQLALRDSQAQRTVTPAQRDLLDMPLLSQ